MKSALKDNITNIVITLMVSIFAVGVGSTIIRVWISGVERNMSLTVKKETFNIYNAMVKQRLDDLIKRLDRIEMKVDRIKK